MNLAASLRPCYASPVAGFVEFPSSKYDYAKDDALRDAAVAHWLDPIDSGPHSAVRVGRLFEIDGVSMFGRLWYIRPTWISKLPPKAIWLRIPCQTKWPKHMRHALDAAESAHISDGRAKHLGIARYLVRALSFWVERTEDFDEKWLTTPFGSSVVLAAIETNPKTCSFLLQPKKHTECVGHTATQLQALWKVESMPPAVCIDDLELEKQYNSSTALVKLAGDPMPLVLKCEVDDHGIYHEIKVLLKMSQHENIVKKPSHLVTMKEGGAAKGVVRGMLLEHYPLGNLEDYLRPWPTGQPRWATVPLKWAVEITQALIHVSKHDFFCSDLRMDNILLERVGDDVRAVLIDFQMDRNIFAWTPPELLCIEWVKEVDDSDAVSLKDKEPFGTILRKFLELRKVDTAFAIPLGVYDNTDTGWYLPWVLSTKPEREKAMVYLLGKVLWCLFEGNGVIGNVLGRSHVIEPDIEFGTFKRTPQRVRKLIRSMTAGAREWTRGQLGLYRKGALILPRKNDGTPNESAGRQKTGHLKTNKKRWEVWRAEAENALRLLRSRCAIDEERASSAERRELGYLDRPQLSAVLSELRALQRSCSRNM